MKRAVLCLAVSICLLMGIAAAQSPAPPAAAPPAGPQEKPGSPPDAPAAPATPDKPAAATPGEAAPPAAEKPAPPPPEKPQVPILGRPLGSGTAGKGGAARFFDPKSVETLKGSVEQVQRGPLMEGGKGNVVRLTLKTDKETLLVVLGPSFFVDQQPVKLAVGDQVEVKASRLTTARGTFMNAVEVKKGDQVLKLRDERGNPLWGGRGLMRQGRKAQE